MLKIDQVMIPDMLLIAVKLNEMLNGRKINIKEGLKKHLIGIYKSRIF